MELLYNKIPKSWKVVQMKYLASEPLKYGANEAALEDDPNNPRFIRITDINEDGTLKDDTFKSLDPILASGYMLEEGDILLARSGATVGKAFLYKEEWGPCCFAGYLIRMRCDQEKIRPEFLSMITQSRYYWNQIFSESIQATIQNFSGEKYSSMKIALPSKNIQDRLVNELKKGLQKIDTLISQKEQLISLLNEKRQALITQAVTKGLDPKIKLVDSGIEWLVKVPENWEVVQMKYLASEPLKYGANEAALEDDPNNPRFIRITDIDEDGNLKNETFKSLDPVLANDYMLEEGDVLLARSGATVGKAFLYKKEWGPCCFAGYLIRMRSNGEKILPEFLSMITQSDYYWSQINSESIQATIQNFSGEKYSSMKIILPEIEEQKRILRFLNTELAKLISLKHLTEETIQLLQERRTALISAAVTGQLEMPEK